MHQRSCKIYKSLKPVTQEDESNDSDVTSHPIFQHTSTSTSTPKPIPGIKLPKSSTQWSEANAFFQLEFRCLDAITDIDSFANRFQEAIYPYFAANCGILKMKSKPVEHINRDIRRLKTKLRNLKSLAQIDTRFNNEIRMLSKQIRAILKNQ
ncbi:hypothetical protein HELRODRAFT_160144 [Helobdella robusta]|uniref:Uncharacterized protein n=1 Tax=Helobdella robusta TaxID=6412 RepID=T1EPV8_HELRO|nr:hypothetical protein HELRODRAFT_160144 [Helobdella robusta]ESO06031.1 hypothetical protein HELRODRAFT_160144 [Helobdella robusta]